MGRRLVKTGGILIVTAVAAACVYLVLSCWWHNLEREEITDSVRQAASGSFAHLSDGFTHYEIAGLGSSRTVVLIHGFSVPYYLWDKTFDPLVKAGFCVLRYDLYGAWALRPSARPLQRRFVRPTTVGASHVFARANAGGSGGSVHGWFDRGDLCGSTSGESAHTFAVRSLLQGG